MEKLLVTAPIDGWLVPLSDVPDPAFAGGMIGKGVAIDPLGSRLHAPCDGTIASIAKACHAITIRSDSGAQILVHVGIDTVGANGAGLTVHVEQGQRVARGDVLIEVALDELLEHATSLVTPIIVLDAEDATVAGCSEAGPVKCGAPLFELGTRAAQHPELAAAPAGATLSETVTVALKHGIHARPAAEIVRAGRDYAARLVLRNAGRTADARSMTAMMALGAAHGDRIVVEGSGPDAADAVRAVAKVLTTAHAEPEPLEDAGPAVMAPGRKPAGAGEIPGIVASRGLAVGFARRLRRTRFRVVEEGEGPGPERRRLAGAVRQAADRLRGVGEASRSDILAAQLELLEDPALLERAIEAIGRGKSAAFAWRQAVSQAQTAFSASRDRRIAERVADLRDIEEQVLLVLVGNEGIAGIELAADSILLADDLLPSEFARIDLDKVVGIGCAGGGPTSHAALMAAARGIPSIVAAGPDLLRIGEGTRVLLDAERGVVVPDPDESLLATARRKIDRRRKERSEQVRDAVRPAVTADGVRIEVLVNVASENEARDAIALGAEGCGLLRTELLYLDREDAPGEDEQAERYRAIARVFGARPLVIRTLDVGGDKALPYLPLPAEQNPLLGLRGLRATLRVPRILEDQLAAILRVEPPSECRILLPMVTEPGEIRAVRRMLESLLAERRASRMHPLGAMIETPASVALADAMAREADFLSIGSNDLAQYTLAMDRTHPALGSRFDHLHPAVLRQIATVCAAAAGAECGVSVCGALATEPAAVPILIGLGVRTLSVVPGVVPELKALIRRLRLRECEEMAARVLELEDAPAVRRFVMDREPPRARGTAA